MEQQERRRAVVMGGSSGIGKAAAALFARRDIDVAITGRDRGTLDLALHDVGHGTAHAVDATAPSDVARFFAAIGPFDYLVLAVSGGARVGAGPFRDLDLAALRHRRGFEAKFWAYVATLQAALPTLRAGGSATFVTAVSARPGSRRSTARSRQWSVHSPPSWRPSA